MSTLPKRRLAGWAVAAACALLLPAPGRAATLPIVLDPNGPTIDSAYPDGTLSYDRGTGNFHSDSVPLSITRIDPFVFGQFSSGNVSIDLFVDTSGNFVSNGSGFVLTGGVDLDGDGTDDATGTLLTGTITGFGADPAGPPTVAFNGTFVITGGSFTQPIPLSGGGTQDPLFNVGDIGGFFLFAESVTSGTLGDFSASFSSDSGKDLEGPVLPAPPGAVLALIGAGMLLSRSTLRRRKLLAALCNRP